MPLYRNELGANILFIHIPKTGGSIIEKSINKKKKFTQTLRQYGQPTIGMSNKILDPPYNQASLQHQFYTTLYQYRNKLNINFDNIKVFSVVRNPYDRIISDLFWLKLINKGTTPQGIFITIKTNYLYRNDIDNHNVPQYKYVTNENFELYPNIKIFRTENLNEDNKKMNDFLGININIQEKKINKNYNKYLNKDSISLINEFYKKDFELFNYDMKSVV